MFVSVSFKHYQAASIFIPPEEINFPLLIYITVLSSLTNKMRNNRWHSVATSPPASRIPYGVSQVNPSQGVVVLGASSVAKWIETPPFPQAGRRPWRRTSSNAGGDTNSSTWGKALEYLARVLPLITLTPMPCPDPRVNTLKITNVRKWPVCWGQRVVPPPRLHLSHKLRRNLVSFFVHPREISSPLPDYIHRHVNLHDRGGGTFRSLE